MWMNEHDVAVTLANVSECHDVEEVPNLYTAARILDALVYWTNNNSDGWPYWKKPQQAAARLMDALHSREYAIRFGNNRDGSPLTDVDDTALKQMLVPIKSFLRRQNVNWHDDLPWAALFPAA